MSMRYACYCYISISDYNPHRRFGKGDSLVFLACFRVLDNNIVFDMKHHSGSDAPGFASI